MSSNVKEISNKTPESPIPGENDSSSSSTSTQQNTTHKIATSILSGHQLPSSQLNPNDKNKNVITPPRPWTQGLPKGPGNDNQIFHVNNSPLTPSPQQEMKIGGPTPPSHMMQKSHQFPSPQHQDANKNVANDFPVPLPPQRTRPRNLQQQLFKPI